jgi:hypothetical protein
MRHKPHAPLAEQTFLLHACLTLTHANCTHMSTHNQTKANHRHVPLLIFSATSATSYAIAMMRVPGPKSVLQRDHNRQKRVLISQADDERLLVNSQSGSQIVL